MTQVHWQELNLLEMLDILRSGGLACVALRGADAPYALPMHYQLEMRGMQPVLHMAWSAQGRKAEALRDESHLCVLVLRRLCAWTDSVLAEGVAQAEPAEGGLHVTLPVTALSGRRMFLQP